MGICVFQYIYVEFCNQEYKAIVEDQTRELEWSYHTQIQILSSSKIDDSILVSSLKFYVKTKKIIIYKTNIYVKWIFFFKKKLTWNTDSTNILHFDSTKTINDICLTNHFVKPVFNSSITFPPGFWNKVQKNSWNHFSQKKVSLLL